MRDCYPSQLHRVPQEIHELNEDFFFNILYLQEHGLCATQIQQSMDGQFHGAGAKITAKGIDFLEDDGGLSAILGVVTVRLEADTVRQLIAEKIENTDLSPEEKTKWKSFVKSLSDASLRTATSDLVKIGINHIPNVIDMLRSIF
jgi:hypothetical protein